MSYKIRSPKQKEASEVVTESLAKSMEWLDTLRTNPRMLAGAAIIFLMVVSASLAFWYFDRQREESAWTLEAKASRLFHDPAPLPQPKEEGKPEPEEKEITDKTERLKESARLYEELLQKYPRSSSTKLASYTLGHVYHALKEYDQAEKQYRAFLEKYPKEKDWNAVIHLELAALQQVKGNNDAALASLRTAYEMPGIRRADQAAYELGRLLERLDKKTEAIDIYKKISEGETLSPWGQEAKTQLALIAPPTPVPTPTPVAALIPNPEPPPPAAHAPMIQVVPAAPPPPAQ
jgi:predicted negative regulator of RcsB-dependent stress response